MGDRRSFWRAVTLALLITLAVSMLAIVLAPVVIVALLELRR